MKLENLQYILEHQRIGVAGFSSDLSLVKCNSIFRAFGKTSAIDRQAKIDEIIPETIGLEDTLMDLMSGKDKHFILENVNRKQFDNQIMFYNLFFYPYEGRRESLLCLVMGVTDAGRQEQKIRQQKFEIRLLEGLLDSRRRFISESIQGDSEPIRKLREMIDKVSQSPARTILIQGDSGTGKNLVARMIHQSSKMTEAPFVEVHSTSIPENMLESELFGSEKGAASKTSSSGHGLIEAAAGGTLYMNEVGELSPKMQTALQSFLETRKFRPHGSSQEKEVHVRFIGGTKRDLKGMVERGEFQEDLYSQLNVVSISLPLLRDLGKDILKIALYFIEVYNTEFKKNIEGFTRDAEKALLSHSWPGNVRELANCVERAMIFIDKDKIDSSDLIIPNTPR
jgi:DNA-binding NtrC family response regulator